MHIESIMVRDPVYCRADQSVGEVLELLKSTSTRMIPVVDDAKRVVGAINTIRLLAKLVPEYIVSGELGSVPYVPDLGVLRKHYQQMLTANVSEAMEKHPTVVKTSESLLSVATSLISNDYFDYALVVNDRGELQGVVAPSDILACLGKSDPGELFDA